MVFFVPSGGLKDAQKGFPRVKFVHQNSDGQISAIVDFKKVDGYYQLESACSPDYRRLNPKINISNGSDKCHLSQVELVLSGIESLAHQSDNVAYIVSVQTALST